MIQKTIGIYNDTPSYSPFNEDTLIIEISNEHIACLVKNEKSNTVSAFEFFKVDNSENDWDEILYELRINSGLLDKSYDATKIYYNVEEATLIPSYKFTATNAELFLNLIHGERPKTTLQHDEVKNNPEIINAYRIENALFETISKNFLNVKSYHIYSSLLNNLFAETATSKAPLIKVQFYNKKFIVTVTRNGKLEVVQRFNYKEPEDVLYILLNIQNQFELQHARLQLSGFIDLQSAAYQYLQQNFTDIYLDQVAVDENINEKINSYPLHYFAPFFNLEA